MVASLEGARGLLSRFDCVYSDYITQGCLGGALAGCYEPTCQELLFPYTLPVTLVSFSPPPTEPWTLYRHPGSVRHRSSSTMRMLGTTIEPAYSNIVVRANRNTQKLSRGGRQAALAALPETGPRVNI